MSSDWQRSLVTLTATVVLVALVTALYFARSVFVPIALAIFLAFVLGPVVARLQRRGLPKGVAVILTVTLVLLATVGVGTVVAQQISKLTVTLPDRAETIKAKIAAAQAWIGGDGTSRFGELIDDITNMIAPKPTGEKVIVAEQASPSWTSQLSLYLTPAVAFLTQAAFTVILTIFMLLKKEDMRNRVIRLLGDGKVTTTTRAVDDASQRISRYLLMQVTINTGFGAVATLGLFALGVDFPLLWGFLASIMRYVPYIGTPIGLLPPVLYSFATAPDWGGGWGQPLAVIAMFAVIEAIANNVFEPWLYGKSMGLSELALIVSAGFWAFLWGPIGLILSSPIMVCLLVLGRHVRRFEFLDIMLGDQPALSPQVAFYQRLAARDQDEASDVALGVAKKDGTDVAMETVIIPALCIARRDSDDGDLDAADFRYAVRAAGEIVTEIAEQRAPVGQVADEVRVRVLIVPTRDEAERVAAEALATTLDSTRWEARVASDEMLASELVALVEEFDPGVVVLVALAPGGLSHSRYLLNRLRAKCAGVSVIVARWGSETVADKHLEKLEGSDGVDPTLTETKKRLADLLPVLAAKEEHPEAPTTNGDHSAEKRKPLGTAGA